MTTNNKPAVTTLSIRELTRSGKILQNFDYINIEDRKSHRSRGVFVSQDWADDVKAFLDDKIKKERKKKSSALMEYAGIANGDTKNRRYSELAAERSAEYK